MRRPRKPIDLRSIKVTIAQLELPHDAFKLLQIILVNPQQAWAEQSKIKDWIEKYELVYETEEMSDGTMS